MASVKLHKDVKLTLHFQLLRGKKRVVLLPMVTLMKDLPGSRLLILLVQQIVKPAEKVEEESSQTDY